MSRALPRQVNGLRNWYDLAVQNCGRTTANTAWLAPEAVAEFMATLARGDEPETTLPDVPLVTTVKMVGEDLKAYYNESVSAQPGRATDSASLANWFWGETVVARVLNKVRLRYLDSDDRLLKLLGTLLLIPRTQLHRFEE